MVAAVIEDHAEIHYGKSSQIAARRRFHNSFFYRWNVVPGDGATEDVIHKFKILAALQRFHFDLAVAVLAVTAALLFVATLHVGLAANGFTIRNFRRL